MTVFRKLEVRVVPPGGLHKEARIAGRRVRFQWRPPGGLGRFGGGWDIEAGIQIGGSTVIINLGFCSVRIDRRRGQ